MACIGSTNQVEFTIFVDPKHIIDKTNLPILGIVEVEQRLQNSIFSDVSEEYLDLALRISYQLISLIDKLEPGYSRLKG